MEIQESGFGGEFAGLPVAGWGGCLGRIWADGLDGQEDELEDVSKGKLDAPTDDEGPGSVDESNDTGRGLESEDEDDEVVERIERRDSSGAEEDLARRAGVRLPE